MCGCACHENRLPCRCRCEGWESRWEQSVLFIPDAPSDRPVLTHHLITSAARPTELAWPCDDYRPPLTCFTTPKPKTTTCAGCLVAFPSGDKIRALYNREVTS